MTGFDPELLRSVRTLDDVLEFLGDQLDWPTNQIELEDASFEFSPDELGIPAADVPSLKSVRQLRPLTAAQPWGIFFLEFAGPKLPITPLRRLLHAVVQKKRASSDSRRTWHLDDLLFVTATASAAAVELHLVAFFDGGGAQPEIRSLPWNPDHSTRQHLRRLAWELLPRLEWPEDPEEADAWRAGWREAFALRHGEALANAAQLADRMASVAGHLRERIGQALVAETGAGSFTRLLAEVRDELVADVDAERFADMCAQTLVYGALTARIVDPHGFGASPVLSTVPLSNPFLTAFFEQVHDQVSTMELDDSGLDALVADLRATNVEGILDHFGATARGGDPVIHFYEEFLTRYDRRMRADAGAFYTPQPVVEFIVRAVDEVLRTRFGLEAGVADDATWADVADNAGVSVPTGVDPNSAFVSMLDPATGTGTFLVEWLRRARTSYLACQRAPEWPSYRRDHVVPQMHAFELMLAPYAIAHLKVALELDEHRDGVEGPTPSILLTDTLDHPAAAERFEELADPVAAEGHRAAAQKRDGRFTVVIGNPPYDREQRDDDDDTGRRRKGGIVRYGVPGIDPLLESVLAPLRAAGMGVHAKNVYNDYVYFWRYATWQATDRRPGPGIVAFITAASFLDGKSLGGLRHHLRDVFDELWIIDLGGEGRGAVVEENVFDIRTPVAIAIGVRHRGQAGCDVRYVKLGGSRSDKFIELATLALSDGRLELTSGSGMAPLTPAATGDYTTWPAITDIFPWVHSGSEVKRLWPIAPSVPTLEARWRALVTSPGNERAALLKETRDRKVDSTVHELLNRSGQRLPAVKDLSSDSRPERLARYGYRSFDRQWILADNRVADYLRPDLWKVAGDRQIYFTTLTATRIGRGPVLTVAPDVPDRHHFRGSYGGKDVMPLWRDPDATNPNLPREFVNTLSGVLGTRVTPETIAAYVYGLTGTSAFASRFADELAAEAGPVHIPFTADPATFAAGVELGTQLLHLHTWGERYDDAATPLTGAAREIDPVTAYPTDFAYDAAAQVLRVGSGRFGPVSPDVWEFEVSGLRAVRSWLGYRMANPRGRRSSPLDEIGPDTWTASGELLSLLHTLEATVGLTPAAEALIERVLKGRLLTAGELPEPSEVERRAPAS